MRLHFPLAPFRDLIKAEQNWRRLEKSIPAALRRPLAALLEQSPDPDGALNLLERYARTASAEVLGDLARRPAALSYLIAAFSYGSLLSETFLAEPGLPLQFAADRHFTELRTRDNLTEDYARFSSTQSGLELAKKLGRFKRRNDVRVALKDVLGLATLADTTLELSALADVILAEALAGADQELGKRFGRPQYRDAQGRLAPSGFSVISLGKLGGSELNYSSDIDLLFLYARDGETAGGEGLAPITNKEYFVRLAQAVVHRLTESSSQGQVFRVDLRLRPEGNQGDLALSLAAALEYYARRARDWELQMLIKARHSAGDAKLTRSFLGGVEAKIYRSPANFEAIASVLLSRDRISRRLGSSRFDTLDVKRHPGGLRDIEFLTQCLQRLHGASDPWVRSGGTLHALRKLHDKELLSNRDYASLSEAYEFLRKVEHRIQLDRGRQSHRLPSAPDAADVLARRLGIDTAAGQAPGPALVARVSRVLQRVGAIYARLVRAAAPSAGPEVFELRPPGGDAPAYSYSSALGLLDSEAPELAYRVREANFPERVQPRVARFVGALLASAESLALAREGTVVMERALEVLGASEYLSGLLIRYPQDLAVLVGKVPPASLSQLTMRLDSAPESTGQGPAITGEHTRRSSKSFPWADDARFTPQERLGLLRKHFRAQVLRLGAQDCIHGRDVYRSLRRWSGLAVSFVASAYRMAAEMLPDGSRPAPSLAVLGLGRLGLDEFDLGSDADLVFVAPAGTAPDDLSLSVRLAEKVIESLSSYTRDGFVIAVDTRLRPRGSEGELVVTENALTNYLAAAAHPWEALTYLKAYPVAGDPQLGWRLISRMTQALFDRFSQEASLSGSLRAMRQRLETETGPRSSPVKTAPGGYYDADFVVSYVRLRHRLSLPPGSNMPEQIAALASAGILAEPDARTLSTGTVFLRAIDHAARLVTGKPARASLEHWGQSEEAERLLELWGLITRGHKDDSLGAKLLRVQHEVRGVFNRIFDSE